MQNRDIYHSDYSMKYIPQYGYNKFIMQMFNPLKGDLFFHII